MAMDLRQVVAAILTMSMFLMLGNMIKKDHIDPLLVDMPVSLDIQQGLLKVSKHSLVKLASGPWKEDDEAMRPCWKKLYKTKKGEQTNGYISLSLTKGPEYHALQIANAIMIAKHLGATLVLPDIKGAKVSEKRMFGEIYDPQKFTTSLDGVIQVVKDPINQQVGEKVVIVKVPERVTEKFISAHIEPILKKKKQVRLTSQYQSSNLTKAKEIGDYLNPYACLAMFGSLDLHPQLKELVDSMVRTLRFLSWKSSAGKFITVDVKVTEFKNKLSCQRNDTTSKEYCYGAEEIGQFLEKIGFRKGTTVYLTQTEWHESLRPLRKYFPNTFTKDAVMPIDLKARYLDSGNFEYEKFIDFYLCMQSDVFVATTMNMFYNNVAEMRIASGKTQILIPANKLSTSAADYLSPHILKKNHMAYSCLCKI
nr:protein MANNAN SYNTHESIS-RELATED 1-like isoform X1 [Coffea arabica]